MDVTRAKFQVPEFQSFFSTFLFPFFLLKKPMSNLVSVYRTTQCTCIRSTRAIPAIKLVRWPRMLQREREYVLFP